MKVFNKFVNNTRKPEGFLGKLMVKSMNHGHNRVSKWGIDHIPIKNYRNILDIGCGGGMNIKRFLLKYPDAMIYAVDYSDVSVEKTRALNRLALDSGRLQVLQADVSKLPFEKAEFDLITAFETIYFWPNLEDDFKGIYNILKPQGVFAITNEINEMDQEAEKWTNIIDGMRVYNREQLTEILERVGFSNIKVTTENKWICITGERL